MNPHPDRAANMLAAMQDLVSPNPFAMNFKTLTADLNEMINDIRSIVVVTLLEARRPHLPDYTAVKERLKEELHEACACLYETKGDLPIHVTAHFLHLFSWERIYVKEGKLRNLPTQLLLLSLFRPVRYYLKHHL